MYTLQQGLNPHCNFKSVRCRFWTQGVNHYAGVLRDVPIDMFNPSHCGVHLTARYYIMQLEIGEVQGHKMDLPTILDVVQVG
jgi:hypothetical protein